MKTQTLESFEINRCVIAHCEALLEVLNGATRLEVETAVNELSATVKDFSQSADKRHNAKLLLAVMRKIKREF